MTRKTRDLFSERDNIDRFYLISNNIICLHPFLACSFAVIDTIDQTIKSPTATINSLPHPFFIKYLQLTYMSSNDHLKLSSEATMDVFRPSESLGIS